MRGNVTTKPVNAGMCNSAARRVCVCACKGGTATTPRVRPRNWPVKVSGPAGGRAACRSGVNAWCGGAVV